MAKHGVSASFRGNWHQILTTLFNTSTIHVNQFYNRKLLRAIWWWHWKTPIWRTLICWSHFKNEWDTKSSLIWHSQCRRKNVLYFSYIKIVFLFWTGTYVVYSIVECIGSRPTLNLAGSCHLTFWIFGYSGLSSGQQLSYLLCHGDDGLSVRQENPTNCGTKAADVLANFLAGKP